LGAERRKQSHALHKIGKVLYARNLHAYRSKLRGRNKGAYAFKQRPRRRNERTPVRKNNGFSGILICVQILIYGITLVMKKNDEQLISDYLEGDERSLGVLVDRYLINIYNFAYKLANDPQAANDITQESFIKAWKNIRKYRKGSNFQNWLLTLTKNTAIDWLRKRKDLAFSTFENEKGVNIFAETLTDDKPSPLELLARAEDSIFVQELLNELNPLYRDVLTLRYSSDFTFEEIGKLLKRPLHTVKSQHRRALVAFRRLFQAESA